MNDPFVNAQDISHRAFLSPSSVGGSGGFAAVKTRRKQTLLLLPIPQ